MNNVAMYLYADTGALGHDLLDANTAAYASQEQAERIQVTLGKGLQFLDRYILVGRGLCRLDKADEPTDEEVRPQIGEDDPKHLVKGEHEIRTAEGAH